MEIFEDDPSYFIYEAKNLLDLRTGKLYSTYAVIRAMERLGLTLKMVCAFCVFVLAMHLHVVDFLQLEYEAKERSPVERRRYQREISCYPPEYLIFLDEMSTTGPKFRRRRGRIRNGQRVVMVRPLGPPGQTGNSLIAACNIRGVMV